MDVFRDGRPLGLPDTRRFRRRESEKLFMKTLFYQMWVEDQGVLSFEWVLLLTLLAIGIVSGLAAARDAIIDELGDVAEAAISLDQSFVLRGIERLDIPDVKFDDTKPMFSRGERSTAPAGQGAQDDVES